MGRSQNSPSLRSLQGASSCVSHRQSLNIEWRVVELERSQQQSTSYTSHTQSLNIQWRVVELE
ncbi:hypothetical protein [Nostoc sp.]|uniref:hypothetical protein n=1 Tax=Nostoc sp. TaxID=1180 RepID=UPI002FFD0411